MGEEQQVDVKPMVTIEITIEEHTELKEDQRFLEALQAAGVDNWEGYDYAREIYHESN